MAPLKEASVTFCAAGDNGPCDCLVAESEHAQHELAVPGRSDQGVCVRLEQDGREIGLARVVLSEGYFGPLSQCSGCATRRANRVIDEPRHRWPEIAFVPRSALVGVRTEIRLIPHLGKFDQAVLFKKRLDYETTVFCWLERNAVDYDLVIEIGANIGVYSVQLSRALLCATDPIL